jgi:2',3'-cyclic-nucleotide 2'-phosphodiesterase (5'-nucleotidase family)
MQGRPCAPILMHRLLAILIFSLSLLAELRPLTILHVNDVHAQITPRPDGQGGFAYLQATLKRERADCTHCIVVQAGDMVQGTAVSSVFKGTPIFELANLFRFDAGTLGNHDFDYGPEKLAGFLKIANYPIVSVNLRDGAGKSPVKPYVVIERGGLRIGIIGAMTDTLNKLVTPQILSGMRTTPAMEAIRQVAAELRPKVDVIVLLAHFTPSEETAVLREVMDVNVMVGGHLHTALPKLTMADDRILVRLNSNATELGRLDMMFDTETKKVASSTWRRIAVGRNTIEPDAEMARAVAGWDAKVAAMMDIPIGEASQVLSGPAVKAWCEKVLVDATKADLAYCNAGGMRAAIPKGVVTVRNIWDVMPFDNRIVVGKVKGADLPAIVKNGHEFEAEKVYTLATSDFVAGTSFTTLQFDDAGLMVRDAMVEWVKQRKNVE